MMTLDEAIKHYKEVATELEEEAVKYCCDDTEIMNKYYEYVDEHRQLAEWLRELKAYRGILANADRLIESEYGVVIIEGYKDVIDQMNEVYMEVNTDE